VIPRFSKSLRSGSKKAEVRGHQEELRVTVVKRDDAVKEAIMHAVGLAGGIARQPFAGRWRDVHFQPNAAGGSPNAGASLAAPRWFSAL
jgi:hypothetical protein